MRNLADRLNVQLELDLERGATAVQMTNSAIAVWSAVAVFLVPVIGQLGMDALYRRALSLSATESSTLASALQQAPASHDFSALRAALLMQKAPEITRSNALLLRVFIELLVTLIGSPLTERLLDSVPAVAGNGRPLQESSR